MAGRHKDEHQICCSTFDLDAELLWTFRRACCHHALHSIWSHGSLGCDGSRHLTTITSLGELVGVDLGLLVYQDDHRLHEVKVDNPNQIHHRIVLEELELLVAQVAIHLHQLGLTGATLHDLHSQVAFSLRQCLADGLLLLYATEDLSRSDAFGEVGTTVVGSLSVSL